MPAVKKNSRVHKEIVKKLKEIGMYERVMVSKEPLFPKKVELAKKRLQGFKFTDNA
jgi:hypothetical protein